MLLGVEAGREDRRRLGKEGWAERRESRGGLGRRHGRSLGDMLRRPLYTVIGYWFGGLVYAIEYLKLTSKVRGP